MSWEISWEQANRKATGWPWRRRTGVFHTPRYRHQCRQGPSVGSSRNFGCAPRKGKILVGAAKRDWHEVVVYEADKSWPDYHRAYVFNWSVHGHHENHTAVLRIRAPASCWRSRRRCGIGTQKRIPTRPASTTMKITNGGH